MSEEYRRCHLRMLEIARKLAESPLVSTENAEQMAVNARLTLLNNAAAAHHLAELAGGKDDRARQEEIVRISRPHIDAMPTQHWEEFRGYDGSGEECQLIDDTRGLILHDCPVNRDLERDFPCTGCPGVTSRLPRMAEHPAPPKQPAPPPETRRPDRSQAERDAARVMEILNGMAEELRAAGLPVTSGLAAALITMANTAYYAAAAIEWHPPETTERDENSPHIVEMRKILGNIHIAMGGPEPHQLRENQRHCSRMRRIPSGTTEYICDSPSGRLDPAVEARNGISPAPCGECPYHVEQPRPQPEELIRCREGET